MDKQSISIPNPPNVSCGVGVKFKQQMVRSLGVVYQEIRNPPKSTKEQILKIRELVAAEKVDEANKLKKELRAFCMSGEFRERNTAGLIEHSGRLQIDLDKLGTPEENQATKQKLQRDPHIEAIFRSPSGTGLKAGLRIPKAADAEEHLQSFLAAEHYFKKKYELTIDPQCKDVCRMCFMSYDPDAYFNPDALVLDVEKWKPTPSSEHQTKPKTRRKAASLSQDHPYAQKVLESACEKIKTAPAGQRHKTRLDQARLVGGYVGAGHLQEGEAECHLLEAAQSNTDDPKGAKQTILDGLKHGIASPLNPPQKTQSDNSQQAVVNRSQTPNSASELYLFNEHGTARWKETHNGRILIPVANFTAQIVEELEFDDGEQTKLHFRIEAESGDHRFPEVVVPAEQFNSLSFVQKTYGSRAQIFPPTTTSKDHLSHAIQVRGGEVQRTLVYTHTGWREIDGEPAYLSSSGALDLNNVEVRLEEGSDPKLNKYSLPSTSTPEEVRSGIAASLNFLQVAPYKVTIPLWVAPYAATIVSEIADHFASVYILGPSGCRKTALVVVALCHHGNFSPDNLFTFNDTTNSLEKASYTLKDAPLFVDDFYPTTIRQDQQRMRATFEGLTRSAGNRSGRGRMNSNLKLRRTFYPRGMVWFTGEDLIGAGSALARLTLVEIGPKDVKLEELKHLQDQRHLLPHAITDFLRWWRDNREKARTELGDTTNEGTAYSCYGESLHGRLPRQIALWQRMVRILGYWLIDRQVYSPEEAEDLYQRACDVLVHNAQSLQERIQTTTPTQQFLEIMQALYSAEKLWIKDWQKGSEEKQIDQEFLGWQKDQYVYAQSKTLWHLIQEYCQREGLVFPVGERTLLDHLARDGVLEKQAGKPSESLSIPAENYHSYRVIKLKFARLFSAA